jgi:DNA-binding response OmpR family regulator
MIANKKILIVDEDISFRSSLKDGLLGEGFTVVEASDGANGLFVALREHPDLIMIDIEVPRTAGISMLKTLRKDDWGKGTRVIMLSNMYEMDLVAEALGGGAHDYIVKKDWRIDAIVALVKNRLR